MSIITILTDFGSSDSYVAEVKAALLSYAPGATLVDVSHAVSPGDVRAGQYLLHRTWGRFPIGTVHLAVVDPGVGTLRRALAAQVSGHRFVGPDNGVADRIALPLPGPRVEDGLLVGEVLHVDRFGSLVSNVPCEALIRGAHVTVAGGAVGALRRTFGDVERGRLVAYCGSGGTVEIAVRDGSAAELLGAGVGAAVTAQLGGR